MEEITVKIELRLPFYSWTLHPQLDDSLSDIPFKGNLFSFLYLGNKELASYMDVRVYWQHEIIEQTTDVIDKTRLVQTGIDFLNYLIYHSRTLDIESQHMTFVSPRSVKKITLTIGEKNSEEFTLFENPPQAFIDIISYTDHFPESYEIFTDLLRDDELRVLDFNLLVDAYHAIYESRYSEAIINCLTAIESTTFPILTKWLTNRLFNKNEKNAENILIEMSFANKMEILFGSVYPNSLREKSHLLENIKSINKVRNEIIHKGRRATKLEANKSLSVTSEFLTILIFEHEEDEADKNYEE